MHATPETLDAVDALLVQIRRRSWLTERKRGIFYCRSASWLHFHGQPGAIHADLKVGSDWVRFAADRPAQWRRLLVALDRTAPPRTRS